MGCPKNFTPATIKPTRISGSKAKPNRYRNGVIAILASINSGSNMRNRYKTLVRFSGL